MAHGDQEDYLVSSLEMELLYTVIEVVCLLLLLLSLFKQTLDKRQQTSMGLLTSKAYSVEAGHYI